MAGHNKRNTHLEQFFTELRDYNSKVRSRKNLNVPVLMLQKSNENTVVGFN